MASLLIPVGLLALTGYRMATAKSAPIAPIPSADRPPPKLTGLHPPVVIPQKAPLNAATATPLPHRRAKASRGRFNQPLNVHPFTNPMFIDPPLAVPLVSKDALSIEMLNWLRRTSKERAVIARRRRTAEPFMRGNELIPTVL
jgi:hypothetical protein